MSKRLIISLLMPIMLTTMLFGCAPKTASDYFTESEIATALSRQKSETAKGTVIAIGGGFDQGDRFEIIRDLSIRYSGKDTPRMLYIPSGHKDELDEVEPIIDSYKKAGCETDILLVSQSTTEQCAEKIAWADVIYETGGNLKFLTENWLSKGVYAMMHQAFAEGKVLLGVSTGAMCWADQGYDSAGEPVFRIVTDFPFLGTEAAYEFYSATGLLHFCLCPHFDNISWRQYASKAKKADFPSLCIENGAAVVFRNGSYEVVLDKPSRKVYLYYPAKGIIKYDVTEDTELLSITHYLNQ